MEYLPAASLLAGKARDISQFPYLSQLMLNPALPTCCICACLLKKSPNSFPALENIMDGLVGWIFNTQRILWVLVQSWFWFLLAPSTSIDWKAGSSQIRTTTVVLYMPSATGTQRQLTLGTTEAPRAGHPPRTDKSDKPTRRVLRLASEEAVAQGPREVWLQSNAFSDQDSKLFGERLSISENFRDVELGPWRNLRGKLPLRLKNLAVSHSALLGQEGHPNCRYIHHNKSQIALVF